MLSKNAQAKFVSEFVNWLNGKRRFLYPREDSNLAYSLVMQENLMLVHGKDLEDFKYYPKFLGICLQKI